MTIPQIQYFFAVFKHGNITKVAEELHISRPVISRAISEIEKATKTKLFERTRSGITPTEQGIVLYHMFDSFRNTYNTTIEKLRNPDSAEESQFIRVGVLDASSNWFYPVIYKVFHEKYPNVNVSVVGINADKAVDFIVDGVVDVAFSPIISNKPKWLDTLYLYRTQWVFCTSANDSNPKPSSFLIKEVADLPLALLETLPPPFYSYKNVVLSTKDAELVRIAIASGYACAVLPMEICAGWEDVATTPFDPPQTPPIYLLWSNVVSHNAALTDFINVVKQIDFELLRRSWGNYRAEIV